MFTTEDLKSLQNLIGVMKRASFKEITAPEAITVAMSIQWVTSLKEKIEADLKPKPAPQPEPIQQKGGKKK